jgi:hypothetical protein
MARAERIFVREREIYPCYLTTTRTIGSMGSRFALEARVRSAGGGPAPPNPLPRKLAQFLL